MHPLPELSTASFSTTLPIYHEPIPSGICPPMLQRETELALKIITSADAADEVDQRLTRLEAKLDLILDISLRGYHPQTLNLSPCRVGLEAFAWRSKQACQPEETVLVRFSPSTTEAFQLTIAGRVLNCKAIADEWYDTVVDISTAFNTTSRSLWERWVFQCHRREILGR